MVPLGCAPIGNLFAGTDDPVLVALRDFDVVAFSLSFENDLLHLPALLAAGGVPPFREERAGGRHPFVLAGGFAVCFGLISAACLTT